MAMKSFYKGERLGKRPPCAICGGRGTGDRELLYLTHGVTVWLCAGHRDLGFLTSRVGRDLAVSLGHVWDAARCMTKHRSAALVRHMQNVAAAPRARQRPGSYAWPELRREAEARFARGERPARVIADLRDRHAKDAARPPSPRAMRRWFGDGRWLAAPADEPPGSDPPGPPGPGPAGSPRPGPPDAARREPPTPSEATPAARPSRIGPPTVQLGFEAGSAQQAELTNRRAAASGPRRAMPPDPRSERRRPRTPARLGRPLLVAPCHGRGPPRFGVARRDGTLCRRAARSIR